MKFYFTATVCRFKLAVTRTMIAAVVLFVVFLAFVALAFGDRQVFVMNVGLFYPDTLYAKGLAADFERYAADNLYIVHYGSPEPMLNDVMNARLECAYILPEEYKQGSTIKLYVTDASMGAAVSNVLLTSAYMQDMAADFGYKVLRYYFPGNRRGIMAAISEKNLSYLESGAFMDVEYISHKTGLVESLGNSLYYAQNGIVALFSLLITMLICLRLVQERKTSIAMRITLAGDSAVYGFANITAVFLINIAFFGAAAIVSGAPLQLLTVISYTFFISVFGVLLGDIIKSESVFLGIIVMGFLCTAVLGGVFVDIGGLVPAFDSLKYLFATYYYMEGLKGSDMYPTLIGAAGVIIFALCAINKKRIKRAS